MDYEIQWGGLWVLSACAFLFLLSLVFIRKQKFDFPLLGLAAICMIVPIIAIVRPSTIKLPYGTEFTMQKLSRDVSAIKDQLRSFALGDVGSGKVIYSTFSGNEFSGFELKRSSARSPYVIFRLKQQPRFVEVRSTKGAIVSVSQPTEKDGWFEYVGKFEMYQADDADLEKVNDQLVIEAYF